MQRRSNNPRAFATCQGPHYCQGMQPGMGGCGAPWQGTLTAPLCTPSPLPRAAGGLWGLLVSNHPPWGPRAPAGTSALERRQECASRPLAGASSVGVGCFQSVSRELPPKYSNRTTFGGGKKAGGHPFQGCVPSPWESAPHICSQC